MKSERRVELGKALISAVSAVILMAFVTVGCATAATHYVNPGAITLSADSSTLEGFTAANSSWNGIYLHYPHSNNTLTNNNANSNR